MMLRVLLALALVAALVAVLWVLAKPPEEEEENGQDGPG